MIRLHGLTRRQQALCDILWGFDDLAAVRNFISSLSDKDQKECQTLVYLMELEYLDREVKDTKQAKRVLKKFAL